MSLTDSVPWDWTLLIFQDDSSWTSCASWKMDILTSLQGRRSWRPTCSFANFSPTFCVLVSSWQNIDPSRADWCSEPLSPLCVWVTPPSWTMSQPSLTRSPPSLTRFPSSWTRYPPSFVRSPRAWTRSPQSLIRSPPSWTRSPPSWIRSPPSWTRSPPYLTRSPCGKGQLNRYCREPRGNELRHL